MKTTTVDAMSELWRDGGMLSLDAAPFGERADEGLASLFEIGRRAVHNLRRHCEHKRVSTHPALRDSDRCGW